MGKKTPQAPAPPDPAKTASAQMGSNVQTAIANSTIGNANTYGPQGSTTYDIIGQQSITGPDGQTYQVPRYSQTTRLSPEQQQLYDQQNRLGSDMNNLAIGQTGRLNNVLGTPVSADGLPAMSGVPGAGTTDYSAGVRGMGATNYANGLTNDFSADRQRVEQAMFDRINPQIERDRASLENTLVNQGFQRGTEAFNNAMNQQGQQVNDLRLGITERGLAEQSGMYGMARDRAGFGASEEARAFQQAMQAGQFGASEQSRAFNTALQGAQFGNQARQQSLQEMLALRNQPINEISALMSGGQVSLPNAPQYQGGNVGGADVMGATYNTAAIQNAQYQQQMQQQNAAMGGMYGLGAAGIMGATSPVGSGLLKSAGSWFMSDRRLKRDIRDLGITLMNGVKLYAYKYLWEERERVGVMADELAKVRPDAVVNVGGFLAVKYGAL